jgi:penicillin-binding protein 2
MEFPNLIIQSAPKRYYPDGPAVAAFAGYTGQISERELALPRYENYKGGQEIGKGGLEQQYELELRGQEGSRYVEVDARGRVVREQGAREDLLPVAGKALKTNIDLDLQRFVAALLGDSIVAGVVALDPATGAVLALHSSPAFDPNRFIGGIPTSYWRELSDDPRRPLYNKALQGRYPPASTFKLATAALALQEGIADFDTRMERPCTGGYMYGRYWKCWKREGHGNVTLSQAIAQSCDTYFYQLGLRLTLSKLLAGGVSLKFAERTGIDLPNEQAPIWPEAVTYFDRIFGAGKWTNGVTLNLSIGQGQNTQTVLNMARFYTALATDGYAATPAVAQHEPVRTQILKLTSEQLAGLRSAMGDVVSGRGTAGSAAIQGVQLAGKTGTAQNETKIDHAWFVGFAPQEAPTIVVAVIVYQGEHGYVAARIASKVISHYLKRPAIEPTLVEGD